MKALTRGGALVLLLLLLLPLGLTVSASEGGSADPIYSDIPLSPLEERLYRGMMDCEESIDVSGLVSTDEELKEALQHLRYSMPELFHVADSYSFTTEAGSNAPISLRPSYLLTGDALVTARAEYLLALDEIAAGVDPTWSDEMICLFLHDYLCRHFAYDTSYTIFDAYGLLTEGRGVCQAYTLALTALLRRFDIPVTYATGVDTYTGSPHIWCIVTLGGENYHIDATWGDPLRNNEDIFGMASHENFLKSDAAIDATGHGSRENYGGLTATDTAYDGEGLVLNSIRAPFVFLDGEVYGVTDGRLYRFSEDLKEATLVFSVEDVWSYKVGGYYTFVVEPRPVGVAAYNGLLYLNTLHGMIALDPASGTATTLLTVESRVTLGLLGDGNLLTYLVADSAKGEGTETKTHELPLTLPSCTDGHTMVEYATVPPTCSSVGGHYLRCTVCGAKDMTEIPATDHPYTVTVVPPGYGTAGYTERLCPDCGDRVTDTPVPALPMPTVPDYLAAVTAAEEAEGVEALFAAVRLAREMEPHLDSGEIATAKARLDAVVAAYDTRAEEIDRGFGATVAAVLTMDADLLTPVPTLVALLIVIFRRFFGL